MSAGFFITYSAVLKGNLNAHSSVNTLDKQITER